MNSLPPFEVYFQEYVCRVQDEQLEAEISYVMWHNVMDSPKVITAEDIQISYIRLYKQMRQFTWPVRTVSALAALEVEAYKTFPEKDKLLKAFTALQPLVATILQDNEGLQGAVEAFRTTITEYEDVVAPLKSVSEVIPV